MWSDFCVVDVVASLPCGHSQPLLAMNGTVWLSLITEPCWLVGCSVVDYTAKVILRRLWLRKKHNLRRIIRDKVLNGKGSKVAKKKYPVMELKIWSTKKLISLSLLITTAFCLKF